MAKLGVNVDHVATLRNARGGTWPDPVAAALAAEKAGADSIVCHLREDRRHIRDDDVRRLMASVNTFVQLEMAATPELVRFALTVKPPEVMLVPERRMEVTTEGGLDCVANKAALSAAVLTLRGGGIDVSIFVDPDLEQVTAAKALGAKIIELHTGAFCHAAGAVREKELLRLQDAAVAGAKTGLVVHAGHGLNYGNVGALLARVTVEKVNIGHSIVSRSVFTGFEAAVREMKIAIARH